MTNKQTLYTLVTYLSNGDYYCRGCEVGRSSSTFDIDVSHDINDIVESWGKKLYEGRDPDIYGDWEFTLLINGAPTDMWLPEGTDTFALRQEIKDNAIAYCQSLLDDDQRVKEAKARKAAEAQAAEQLRIAGEREAKEREQLALLKAKYES